METQMTYLLTDGRLFKIGKSINPEKRLKQLQTANPFINMVCFGNGVSEKYLHHLLFSDRITLEWFDLSEEKIETIKRLLEKGEQGRKRCAKPVFEVIEFNGVKFKGKRKSGKYFTLSDSEKKRNADGRKKSDDLSEKYVIPFGKFKGTKMCNMISDEQYDYCVWFYGEIKKTIGTNEKKRSRQYKAFSWAIRNNKNKQ